MRQVTCPQDNRVAVRVGQGVAQDQLGAFHSRREDFVEIRLSPDIIERRSLDFCIGAPLGDAAADDDARTRFGGSSD